MKTIQLTQGRVALVDDRDFEMINKFKWCVAKDGRRWYAMRSLKTQTTIRMHRVILPGIDRIDHRDGDGLNNQRKNLRSATRMQNGQNREKNINGSSKFKGVCWNPETKSWKAQICSEKKKIYLGLFKTEKKAAIAYDTAARKYFGEFARLNFLA